MFVLIMITILIYFQYRLCIEGLEIPWKKSNELSHDQHGDEKPFKLIFTLMGSLELPVYLICISVQPNAVILTMCAEISSCVFY